MKKHVTKKRVLRALLAKNGDYLNGAELAAEFGFSRTAIWKAICDLKADGFEIESSKVTGYKLISCPDSFKLPEDDDLVETRTPLTTTHYLSPLKTPIEQRIQDNLTIRIYNEIDSTNSEARRIAERCTNETLVIAASQTEGRGRLGRSFFSPGGSGLYMSFLLYPDCPPTSATLITTAAAVATARAIDSLTGTEQVGIKWVNDLYIHGKKVCGILTEGEVNFETGNLHHAILGIGINLFPPKNGFPPEIADRAGSVFAEAAENDDCARELANRLAIDIATEFYKIYPRLDKTDYIEEYRRRMFLIGREVDVISTAVGEVKAEDKKKAIVEGLDDDFRLVVRYDDNSREAIGAGEVTLRV